MAVCLGRVLSNRSASAIRVLIGTGPVSFDCGGTSRETDAGLLCSRIAGIVADCRGVASGAVFAGKGAAFTARGRVSPETIVVSDCARAVPRTDSDRDTAIKAKVLLIQKTLDQGISARSWRLSLESRMVRRVVNNFF